jgi:hypothetical protein
LSRAGEGTIDAAGCGQHLVDLSRRHAVRQQRDFKRHLGGGAQAALARPARGVPEPLPVGRTVFQPGAIVGQHHRPDEGADTAGADRLGQKILLSADTGPVDLLEQAFVAAGQHRVLLDLHDVPGDAAGRDHGADLGHLAGIGILGQADAGLFGEGLEEGLPLGLLQGAAGTDHGEVGGPSGASRDHQRRQRRSNTCKHVGSLSVFKFFTGRPRC